MLEFRQIQTKQIEFDFSSVISQVGRNFHFRADWGTFCTPNSHHGVKITSTDSKFEIILNIVGK